MVGPPRRRVSATVRRRRFLQAVAEHSILIAFSVGYLVPLVFVVLTSLMSTRQALSNSLWPRPFVWHNYIEIFRTQPLLRYSLNTSLYAGLSTVGVLVSGVPVAYVLSRIDWRGRQVVFLLVLSTLMLPAQVTVLPLYVIFTRLHWIGTLKPLILPNFFGDAFSIFLLRQFFLTIPQELLDAARVDGGSELQIIRRVVIPVARTGIAAVALFQVLYAWNDFFNPLLYLGEIRQNWTLSLGLSNFTTFHGSVVWNLTMAASVLFILPVIIVFFFAQRVFIQGITLTGIKG